MKRIREQYGIVIRMVKLKMERNRETGRISSLRGGDGARKRARGD